MSKDAERELKGDLDNHKPTYIDYWHDCIKGGMNEFGSYFNEHKGKNVAITATTEAEGAKYRLDVHTTQIYLGSVTAAGLFRVNRRGGGMQFYGTLDVIEVATGKIVAVYDMENVKGTAEYTKKKMVKAVIKFLAKRVGELK